MAVRETVKKQKASTSRGPIYLDSGAEEHHHHHQSDFVKIHSVAKQKFLTANGDDFWCDKKGTLRIHVLSRGHVVLFVLKDVWYIPESEYGLLSLGKLMDLGMEARFHKEGATLDEGLFKQRVAEFERPGDGLWQMVLQTPASGDSQLPPENNVSKGSFADLGTGCMLDAGIHNVTGTDQLSSDSVWGDTDMT